MNKARATKLITATISIVAFLVPLLLGLSRNEYDVQFSFTPQYVAPKVGFKMEKPDVRFVGESLILRFQATNEGEVKLQILSMDVKAYGPDGAELGKPELAQPITLSKGESKNLTLNLNINDEAKQKLLSYFNQSGQAAISLRGEAQVKVFSSTVKAPFSTSFIIKAEELTGP